MEQLINKILTQIETKPNYYEYANLTFSISFNNEDLKNKYTNRIYPFMKEVPKTKMLDFQIMSLINDELYYQIIDLTLKNEKGEDLVASYCTKESGMVRIKKYRLDNYIIILSSKHDAFWFFNKTSKKVYFVGNKNSLQHFHREFYIFFEHIIVKKSIVKGAILMHAAAVKKDGDVILCIGNKRSGKTTTFFELCKHGHCVPLSVDKVLVIPQNGIFNVYGIPTRLRVLAGTLSKYKELCSFIPDAYKNATDEILWEGESESKIEMPIKDFEKFADNDFAIKGKLNTIIFNHIDKAAAKPELYIGVTNENIKIMDKNIFSPNNPEEDWWSDIGIYKLNEMQENRENIVDEIVKKMRFIDFTTKNDFTLLIDTL